MSDIITGVDKLVQIIDTAGGRISLKDAMKQMHVSKDLIEEWANTLEESKTITIEYKLFNTFLVRGVSKAELVKKAKELTLKEEAFEENLNVAVRDFESDAEGLTQIGSEFDALTDELKKKRNAIEQELKHLYEFHKLNKTFQEELDAVDERSKVYVAELEKSINEKKDEYKKLLETIDVEKQQIDEKSKKLGEFLKRAEELNNEISESKDKLSDVHEKAKNIRPTIQNLEKESIDNFLKHQESAVKKISEKQKTFLNEIMLKRKFMKIGLKENQMIKEKLDKFFIKQKRFESTFVGLKEERDRILSELRHIMKLAEEYKALARKKDVTKEFKKLQEKSVELDKRRDKFSTDLKGFKQTIKGKK